MKVYVVFIIFIISLFLLGCNNNFIGIRFNKNKEFFDKKYKIHVETNCEKWFPNIVKYIKNSVKNHEITNNKKDSDIVVYNILNNNFTANKINIILSGETHDINDNVDLYIGSLVKKIGKKQIYYPFMYSSLFNHRKSVDNKDYINNKNKFCAYMYNASYPHRVKIFNLINKYKKVDSLGNCSKNTDNTNTRFIENDDETYNDIAVNIYRNYKFVIAVENKNIDGYNTEKLINPLISNSIPLYWGNDKIFKYINKKRVIYIPDYTDEELLKKIDILDNNIDEYNNCLLKHNSQFKEILKVPLIENRLVIFDSSILHRSDGLGNENNPRMIQTFFFGQIYAEHFPIPEIKRVG